MTEMTIQAFDYNHKNSSSNKITRKELVEHSIFEALLCALVMLLLTGPYDSVQVLSSAHFEPMTRIYLGGMGRKAFFDVYSHLFDHVIYLTCHRSFPQDSSAGTLG